MKILIIFTGGTISCSLDGDGYLAPDGDNRFKLLAMYRKTHPNVSVEFDCTEPYQTLSEQLNGDYLGKLIACLRSNLHQDYEGIIVTHGTDTLQYAAAALGYAAGNQSLPIVLVSSNYMLDDERANGPDNFAAAVDFILGGYGRGVFAAYRNRWEEVTIHRASRMENHITYDDCIYSVDGNYYGRYVNGVFQKNHSYTEREDEIPVLESCWSGDCSDVCWITPYPGFDWDISLKGRRAILIKTYHSGTMNTEHPKLRKMLQAAGDASVPVFLVGAAEPVAYESSRAYGEMGVHLLGTMSPPAAYMKLAMGLACGRRPEEFMYRSLGGDLADVL